jgi:4-amino-4-deoxy-L-arabinose transferase-like glycosyltransferase
MEPLAARFPALPRKDRLPARRCRPTSATVRSRTCLAAREPAPVSPHGERAVRPLLVSRLPPRGAGTAAARRPPRRRSAPAGGPSLNLVWGLAALAAAGLLSLYAWRAFRHGRPAAAAVAIVAAGLVLRLYAGCDLFLHAWDERYHALVAKHLAEHPLVPTLYDRPLLPYDYRDWRANHVWLHKPPLALWMMAASMRLLGVDEIAMRLPSLLLSTLAVLMTWVIGSHLCGRRVGLLAAGLHAWNGYLLQLPGGRVAVDHVDNALLFFVELAIFLAVLQARSRRGGWASWWAWLPAIGAATGLAVLSKWLPGLLPLPVWMALAWDRRRPWRAAAGLAAIGAACAAVALPWQLYIRQAFPLEARWEAAYNLYHLRVPIEGLGGSPLFHLLKMPRFFGELIYLPVGWFLFELARRLWARRVIVLAGGGPDPGAGAGTKTSAAGGAADEPAGDAYRHGGPAGEPAEEPAGGARRQPTQTRRPWSPEGRALLPLAAWLLLPYAAFSLAATKLGGYVMLAAPALFIVEAAFWCWLWDRRSGNPFRYLAAERRGQSPGPTSEGRAWAGRAGAALHWAALALLLLLPLRYTVERMKIRPAYDRNPAWARALRALPGRLGRGPLAVFHLDQPLEAMFYTPYVAYEGVPTPLEARALLASGYRVVVLDAAAAPPELRRIPGVELLREAIPPSPLDDGTGFRLLRANGSDSPLTGTTSPPP